MDDLLSTFPPTSFAFAYGSGVYQQAGYPSTKDGMLGKMALCSI